MANGSLGLVSQACLTCLSGIQMAVRLSSNGPQVRPSAVGSFQLLRVENSTTLWLPSNPMVSLVISVKLSKMADNSASCPL